MDSVLQRTLKIDTKTREGILLMTSAIGIIVNLFLALTKILIGLFSNSIAIISEGANNLSDFVNSIITIIATKLANRHPTKDHPFGFGRIEYISSLAIAVLILFAGYELIKSSIQNIINPVELDTNILMIGIIAGSAVVKFMLGIFTEKQGKKIDSTSLIAIGKDCKNDCIISLITIASLLIYLFLGKNVDGFAGLIGSIFLIRTGFEALKSTIDDLLGTAGDENLAKTIYDEIAKEPIILGAADMVLHNYGPDKFHGSVNIEIDHNKTVEELYKKIHELQLNIMHKYNVTMVFGIYAVDKDSKEMVALRKNIADFVRDTEHLESYHAVYIDPKNNDIYCDFIVDYDLDDWDKLREDFTAYMKKLYPNNRLELVIETRFV